MNLHAPPARSVWPGFPDAGETAALVRAHDWSTTPLGPIDTWPQSLKTAVDLMLGSRQPVYLAWGPELTSLYNDAYIPIVGAKHPKGLGQPFDVLWSEIREEYRPLIEAVMAGEALHFVDRPAALAGRDGVEVGYFTFSWTPLRDESGVIRGFICNGLETTERVEAGRAFRRMFEASPTPFLVLAPDAPRFTIVEVNDAYLSAVMRTREDLLGRGVFEAMPDDPSDPDATGVTNLRASLERAIATKRPDTMPRQRYDIPHPDGGFEERWWDPVNSPLLGAGGEVEAVIHHVVDVTDRKKADETLRATAARNVEILESISDAFYAVDADWRFTYVNHRAEEWWGRSREGLIGKVYWDEFPQAVGSEPYKAHLKAAETREVVRLESLSPILGHWVDVSIYPAADGGLSVYFRDITTKKQAEARVRESEARLKALTDHLPGGMVYQIATGPDGEDRRFTYVSQSHQKLTGVPAEAVLADPSVAYSLIHPDDLPRLAEAESEAIAKGRHFDEEARFRRADGELRWCRIISAPRPAADGGYVWDGIQIDITAQKEAELTRELSRRRLDAILSNTRMAVFLMDERQHCVFANAAAEALTGYSFTEMQGRPLHDVVHHKKPDGSDYPLEECPIDRAFPERAQMDGEELFVARDGSFYPVAFTASPMLDEAGRPIGTVIEARPIAEERAAAAARRQAEDAERLLAQEVDHRAKNILAVVQSMIKLTPFTSKEEYLTAVEGRIQSLARVHSILAQNRWSGARLSTLIERELAPHVQDRSERVRLSGPDLIVKPELVQPLSLVLHELATNAAKYGALSTACGSVSVSWATGETLCIEWRESGGPVVSPPSDMGFGSKLIRGAARQIDATVRKEWAREGLRCRIELPAEHAVAASGSVVRVEQQPPPATTDLAGRRVLVVEDEALIALELERILTQAGAVVVGPVHRHDEALETARSEPYDFALLDANLAGLSSRDVCAEVADRGKPLLILTGYENLELSADWPVLRKPVAESALVAAIADELSRAERLGRR